MAMLLHRHKSYHESMAKNAEDVEEKLPDSDPDLDFDSENHKDSKKTKGHKKDNSEADAHKAEEKLPDPDFDSENHMISKKGKKKDQSEADKAE